MEANVLKFRFCCNYPTPPFLQQTYAVPPRNHELIMCLFYSRIYKVFREHHNKLPLKNSALLAGGAYKDEKPGGIINKPVPSHVLSPFF